jgi:nitroimidazol reductase NimA-like FMN-containing flavoprotein (pyridoxamine 5'-phosphate oxidase superfamily)
VEELTHEECVDLLGSHHFGRIAVHGHEGLAIFPVNYFWNDGHVAIRTNPGTKLAAAAQSKVAFEIDGIDDGARTGWSVLVTGTGYEVTDSMDDVSAAMRALPVETWAPGQTTSWLRVEPASITGRRVRAPGNRTGD